MNESHSERYREAGVDITAGYDAVRRMRPFVEKTFTRGVLNGIGGFGGLFEPDLAGIKRPVLVSGTDGVGTKLKLAFLMDKHDTVGIDCVAMCANDVVCAGAAPLFFLDYIAVGKNLPERVADIVRGVAEGCLQAGCALIGGETAEMPGFYPEDEYDLAGFCVGIADYDRIIDGKDVCGGDALIGLPSSGVHSNGFSLVRRTLDIANTYAVYSEELGMTYGEALLVPTRIYVRALLDTLKQAPVKAVSHITGGGFYENIPRMLPEGTRAVIEKNTFERPPVFDLIAGAGGICERDMYNTYNMGLGMVFAVSPEHADRAAALSGGRIVGRIVPGEKGIDIV